MEWAPQILPRPDAVRSIVAPADDGYSIEAHLTGDGPPHVIYLRAIPLPFPSPPHRIPERRVAGMIRRRTDDVAPVPLGRLPSLEEIICACDELTGPGALMSVSFVTVPPELRDDTAETATAAGVQVTQLAQAQLPGELLRPTARIVIA